MTTQTLTVTPFDPQAASQEARLAVAQLLVAAHGFAYPDDPRLIPEREIAFLSHVSPDDAMRQFAVWDGAAALGWARIDYGLKENLHAAHARLIVHPGHRRRGLGRELARAVETAAQAEGRRLITFGTTNKVPAGEAFARWLGAEPALPMRQSQLLLDEVPGELLNAWTARPDGEPYRLHVWTRIPGEFLTRAADMMMVMNTAPRGDLDVEDWTVTPEMIRSWEKMIEEGGEVRCLMALEDTRTGELTGYSETFWSPERAPLVFQGATAVRPSARGQGLGKWLKAEMVRHLRRNCPGARFVRTNNADENAAMLGINVAMGFTPWGTFTEWQRRLGPVAACS
ncbi:GNAT family N-acetyltransferase [Deinococcus hopiensis]|uniref:Sortase and related acyltransferases n=1 Tax=Deinococcus hopiensis KR-140 TaxID=695939 RepID=A0A1W1V6K6_9DEIO|nr:GNAT family N-acetyltransferase [Deinococcus hopiensis]SMB88634.1 Sortase and related acyltransferases [Deinococcus hopiensis KR-140]